MSSPGMGSSAHGPAGEGGQQPRPSPAMLAKSQATQVGDGQAAVDAVGSAVAGLEGLSELPVREHVQRFENVHTALTDALSQAENLLGGSGHGS